MKNDDVVLIDRILAGDDSAFATLVEKYQKQVHALAWRKIGDFHIAEEITQDTFLQVYQKLVSLKNPNQFSGWLYVIATRRCLAWLRKKRFQTQALEDTDIELIEGETYSRYVAEERAKATAETQREVAKKLLAKLQDSERTVMTLYYFGEMTCEEISKFLGVSTSTIKSRLRRARQRLKKEETIIREALEHFQISPNLTDNIMQEISHLKPAAPSASKPLLPWALAASTFVVAILMLGIGNQYFARFQQPYSFDATSEMKVEIIDDSIVLNIPSKPNARNQLGQSDVSGKSEGITPKSDNVLSTALVENIVLNGEQPSKDVLGIFRTPDTHSQDYTIVEIDVTAFKDGGTLTIDIWVGSAETSGSFNLFDSDTELPSERIPQTALASASGIPSGKAGKIIHRFDQGKVFKLGAIGNSFNEKESVNSFLANISIESGLQ
ncbi:MAG: RNA polymerase sigma factor [Candidatus Poribacteria bacterium]|nr:RNA polymerase sigma factor [Candidatus Poribacteria bacterium]